METEKKKQFDVGAITAVKEAPLEILDLNGNGTGWIWTFAGPGHPITIEADRLSAQETLNREAEIERTQVNGRKWKGAAEKVDDRRARNIGYVVKRLLRWSDIEMNGEAFPCTPENATAVLSNPDMPTLYEQANTFLAADKSFSKGSAKP